MKKGSGTYTKDLERWLFAGMQIALLDLGVRSNDAVIYLTTALL